MSNFDAAYLARVLAKQTEELRGLGYLAALKDFVEHVKSEYDAKQLPRPSRALCLGLGTMDYKGREDQAERVASQLATFLTLLEGFGIERGRVKMHDPMFNAADKEVLGSLGLAVPTTSEEAKEDLICDEPTLLFLPYLPYPVFELIFAQNWSLERLKNIIIIGTKLEGWLDDDNWFRDQKEAFIPRTRKCIPMLDSIAMPSISQCRQSLASQEADEVETEDASYGLDRLQLQWIPPFRIEALGERFWHIARKEDSEWQAAERPTVKAKL